jgi:hypothetical protein
MAITLTPPGYVLTLGREFDLLPNNLARIGEEFYITNGGAVRRMTRDKKEETLVRLTLKAKRISSYANDVVSMFPGASMTWNGFKITIVSIKPTNELRLRIDRA